MQHICSFQTTGFHFYVFLSFLFHHSFNRCLQSHNHLVHICLLWMTSGGTKRMMLAPALMSTRCCSNRALVTTGPTCGIELQALDQAFALVGDDAVILCHQLFQFLIEISANLFDMANDIFSL